jgi:hypothetical protein
MAVIHSKSIANAAMIVVLGAAGLSCSSDSDPEPTTAEYTTALEALCTDTAAQLDELPDPPDGITVSEFATRAGAILLDEANRVRELSAPAELDGDHRALIRNGEQQAAAWDDLTAAVAAADPDLATITTQIAQLNLGRNDLVTDMGAAGCVRTSG